MGTTTAAADGNATVWGAGGGAGYADGYADGHGDGYGGMIEGGVVEEGEEDGDGGYEVQATFSMEDMWPQGMYSGSRWRF